MEDRKLVIKAVYMVFSTLGFNNKDSFLHRDYETVSDAIQAKTNILISVSTLKRLEKGTFSKIPQPGTLNAIAAFLGYKNWQEYRFENLNNESGIENTLAEVFINKPFFKNIYFLEKLPKIIFLVLFLLIILLIVLNLPSRKIPTFAFNRTTKSSLPNTVIFNYDVQSIDADSFFIQQSWDVNRRVAIDPDKHTLTDIYFEPGHHIAKLMANDKIIKTIPIVIPTNGWFHYVKDANFSAIPTYLSTINKLSTLNIKKEDLEKNGITFEKEKFIYKSNIFEKTGINSKNLDFSTKIKVTKLRNDYCPFVVVEIHTQKNPFFLKASIAGCENEALANFGNGLVIGKTSNLSFLSLDVLNWNNIQVVVRNNTLQLLYNGKKVYSNTISEDNGEITGLSFISNGLVEIDYYKIQPSL